MMDEQSTHEFRKARRAAYRAERDPADPVAFEFEHEETGEVKFIDAIQVEISFQEENPRWQLIGPVYAQAPAVAQEPVGELKAKHGNTGVFVQWYKQPQPGDKLYTAPPAVAVNEQMLEALNDFSDYVRTEQSSTDGQMQYSNTQINRLAFKARAAIAAAEAEKARGRG